MKIIIAGAGVGGLFLAKVLSEKDYDISIFENRDKDSLSYDWYDDVSYDTFLKSGISKNRLSFYSKKDWSFIMYGSTNVTKINIPDEKKDISVHRRTLSEELMKDLKGVAFHFGEKVLSPIVKDEKVVGIKTIKGEYYADLIIDSAGVDSPLRTNLPDKAKIQKEIKQEEKFSVYRAFFERNQEFKEDYHTNKAYLRHLGRRGISWAIDGKDVDVLIGNIGSISNEEIESALNDIKRDNQMIIGQALSAGKYIIPVRRPLAKMVWNGYVALGDSAFMTIPMLGSGIRSSILSAKILSEVIETIKPDFPEKKLWLYQARVIKELLYTHYSVDIMKNWLLKASLKDIAFIANSKIVSASDMALVASGNPFELSCKEMFKKAIKGISKPRLLIDLLITLIKGKSALKKAQEIPLEFEEKKVARWINSIEKYYK